MPLFLMGCFPVDFQEVKRPLRTKSVKRPIKVGKRPINEGKRPIKAMVLVDISVSCLMGCFRAPRCVYTNFFAKFARTLTLVPVTRVRSPTEIVQMNLFNRTCLFWVEILSDGFASSEFGEEP